MHRDAFDTPIIARYYLKIPLPPSLPPFFYGGRPDDQFFSYLRRGSIIASFN